MDSPQRTFSDCFVRRDGGLHSVSREVVAEEPLRIVLNGCPIATLMRTPGNEEELGLGFLLTEGIVRSASEVGAIAFCREGLGSPNELRITLANGDAVPDTPAHRMVYSSCSICGTEMIEDVASGISPFDRRPARLSAADIYALAERMRAAQECFRRTGGTHAAAVGVLPLNVDSIVVREDLGRHNALDKAVGAAARQGLDFSRCLVMLSSRLSFEMVAKAARAGFSDAAGVSAPSATAIALARRLDMFLAGFVRGETMTVYSDPEALASS